MYNLILFLSSEVQYMQSMIYPTIFGASPIMYPPMTMLQPMAVPMQQPHPIPTITVDMAAKENESKTNQVLAGVTTNTTDKRMSASQATGVNAEPGSVFGSMVSASVENRVSVLEIYIQYYLISTKIQAYNLFVANCKVNLQIVKVMGNLIRMVFGLLAVISPRRSNSGGK